MEPVKQILDTVGTVEDLQALLLTSDMELKRACGDDAVTALLINAKYVHNIRAVVVFRCVFGKNVV